MQQCDAEGLVRRPIRNNASSSSSSSFSDTPSRISDDEREPDDEEEHSNYEYSGSSPTSTHSSSSQMRNIYPDLSREQARLNSANLHKRREKEKAEGNKKGGNYSNIPTIIWLIIVVSVAIMGYFLFSKQQHQELPSREILDRFLKSVFPQEGKQSRTIIQSALDDVIREDVAPVSPAILLLLASNETEHKNQKFSTCLANLLDEHFVKLNAKDLNQKGLDSARESFRSKIDNYLLGADRLKVVVIENLHKLPLEVAMVLHGYCDHENAPFKRVLFIMTIVSNKNIPVAAENKVVDKYATSLLNEAWQGSHEDERSSLLSRIAISVASILSHITLSECKT